MVQSSAIFSTSLIVCMRDGVIIIMPEFNDEKIRTFYLSSLDGFLINSNESLDIIESSKLIESILLGFPLPIVYCMYVMHNDNWTRKIMRDCDKINSIKKFMNGDYVLTNLTFFTQFEGMSWNNLKRPIQRRIEDAQISVYTISPGGKDMQAIYRFLNYV